MPDAVADLLALLDIERLETDLFRGFSAEEDVKRKRVFGGQVIAQSLVAAYRTVEARQCHSLHAYFIRPGDPTIPIIYEVDRARDGGSFSTRRVIAVQHGKQIFNMAASFHVEETGWNHQHTMPAVAGVDTLQSRQDLARLHADRIPETMREDALRDRPVEMREIDPINPLRPRVSSDINHVWFRMARAIEAEPWLHHCLVAYATDMSLLGSSYRPHGLHWIDPQLMSASLDHAIWFHGPIQFTDWHLYTMDSPYAGEGRSFNRGMIYTADGKLVASCTQEGLMRRKKV